MESVVVKMGSTAETDVGGGREKRSRENAEYNISALVSIATRTNCLVDGLGQLGAVLMGQ